MFGNLPGLNVCEGDNVSWHLLGLGSEADVHGVVFQGNTLQMNGMRRDSTNLFPHTFATAFMQPDNKGKCLHISLSSRKSVPLLCLLLWLIL